MTAANLKSVLQVAGWVKKKKAAGHYFRFLRDKRHGLDRIVGSFDLNRLVLDITTFEASTGSVVGMRRAVYTRAGTSAPGGCRRLPGCDL